MSNTVIKVENLSKQYRLGLIGGKTVQEDVQRWWARMRGKPDPLLKVDQLEKPKTPSSKLQAPSSPPPAPCSKLQAPDGLVWALQDVSFEVKQGEILGIIGRNGAGKSTLLKILTKITAPTSGKAMMKGRVGALLEVGTGFHPELTGRENIFLSGAILGMTRIDIKSRLDEIIDFSGCVQYIDTPVKRYSSGMGVRLGFAVAAHLEPEILLVDEVLAVGDAQFQKKCLGKMGDVAKEGRTVLFVSHNMIAMQSLCNRTLWLDNGIAVDDGKTDRIISKYLQVSCSTVTERTEAELSSRSQNDNDIVQLHSACIRPVGGSPRDPITIRTSLVMEFEFSNNLPEALLDINIHFITEQNILAFVGGAFLSQDNENNVLPIRDGRYLSRCFIPPDLLNDGMYNVRLFFGKDNRYVRPFRIVFRTDLNTCF